MASPGKPPKITILFDAVLDDYQTEQGLPYIPVMHIVFESNWLRMVRRRLRNENLFHYYHLMTGNIMLAYWIHKPGEGKGLGLMIELEALEWHPDWLRGKWGTPPELPSPGYLRWRIQPRKKMYREMKKAVEERAARRRALKAETEEERQDSIRWLRRNHYDDVARRLARGEIEYAGLKEAPEAREQARDLLQTAARKRIITYG